MEKSTRAEIMWPQHSSGFRLNSFHSMRISVKTKERCSERESNELLDVGQYVLRHFLLTRKKYTLKFFFSFNFFFEISSAISKLFSKRDLATFSLFPLLVAMTSINLTIGLMIT